MRAVSGGQFGVTGPATEYARALRGEGKTWQAEFENTAFAPIGKAATQAGKLPVVKQARGAYRKYAETVFGDINGPIERFYKTGMLGKEIKQPVTAPGPQDHRTDQQSAWTRPRAAITARARRSSSAREIDRAYGKYSKHSPRVRGTRSCTPRRSSRGCATWPSSCSRVLPKDHPVATSLTRQPEPRPTRSGASSTGCRSTARTASRIWIMGSYPAGKDKYVRAARYMPFAARRVRGRRSPARSTRSSRGAAEPVRRGLEGRGDRGPAKARRSPNAGRDAGARGD